MLFLWSGCIEQEINYPDWRHSRMSRRHPSSLLKQLEGKTPREEKLGHARRAMRSVKLFWKRIEQIVSLWLVEFSRFLMSLLQLLHLSVALHSPVHIINNSNAIHGALCDCSVRKCNFSHRQERNIRENAKLLFPTLRHWYSSRFSFRSQGGKRDWLESHVL